MNRPVAQVEFFLINFDEKQDIKGFMEDCLNREQDGFPIKICFRFYDSDHEITAIAKKINSWHLRYGNFGELINIQNQRYPKILRGLRRWWLYYQKSLWQNKLDGLLKIKIWRQLDQGKPLAIELPDRRYRYIKESERPRLIKAMKRVSKWFLFIFQPNDLLSDNNEIIATVW